MTIIIFQLFSGGHKPGGISIFFISNYLNKKQKKGDPGRFPSRIDLQWEFKTYAFLYLYKVGKEPKEIIFKIIREGGGQNKLSECWEI